MLSEVANVTGTAEMSNTSVKVFFGTKTWAGLHAPLPMLRAFLFP